MFRGTSVIARVPQGSDPRERPASTGGDDGCVFVANRISEQHDRNPWHLPGCPRFSQRGTDASYDSGNGELYVTDQADNNVSILGGGSACVARYAVTFPGIGPSPGDPMVGDARGDPGKFNGPAPSCSRSSSTEPRATRWRPVDGYTPNP